MDLNGKRIAILATDGSNVPDDAVYPTAFVDAEGKPFDSGKRYHLHFDKNSVPSVRAFWSLTM
jgi:hypothetical protein